MDKDVAAEELGKLHIFINVICLTIESRCGLYFVHS